MPESDDTPLAKGPERPASASGKGPTPTIRANSLIGSILAGRYRIEKLLGEGGMGAVYLGEHTHMRKRFAIKVLHAEMGRLPEVVARFEREAMAAAHIEHPNVAAATDFGKLEDGSFFLVLEYVEGKSLRDLIALGRLELGRALRILRQIGAGLQRAHALGIVHRDLKPENVMLIDRDGEPDFVKVLDFGIAKVPVGELSQEKSAPGTALTQLGMVYGTPEYMAPEQALGQPVDPRADIYSLGVIAYEMIAGVRPFEHSSKVTLLGMHVTAPVPPFTDKVPGLVVPGEVDQVVRRMLEKEATNRFADARALLEGIDSVWASDYGAIPRSSMQSNPSLTGERSPISLAQPLAPGAPAQPGAPLTVTGRYAGVGLRGKLENQLQRAKDAPKPYLIAGAALFASVLLLVLLSGGGTKKKNPDGDPAPVSSGEVPAGDTATADTPKVPSDVEQQIVSAVQAIERGDYGTGISQLSELEKTYSGRADLHRALEKAFTATRNPKEALRETELLLKADPQAASDLKIAENVRNAAIGRDAPDAAFSLLESKMGAMGPDILYDIAYGASGAQYPAAAQRAQRALQKGDVRKTTSPALAISIELRAAQSCESKKSLLQRAKDLGDSRTLTILKQYTATRGCGFANARDCWPCLRREGALTKAIQGLEERIR